MKKNIGRIGIGLAFIVGGGLLLLNNFTAINFGDTLSSWWPIIIIVASIIMLLNDRSSYLWAALVFMIGAIFQLRELDIVSFTPWQIIWPLVIIFIGISILVNLGKPHGKIRTGSFDAITAILGGNEKRNTSDDFTGANVTAILGGAVLDISRATIKKEATISLFSFWGGIEIVVPRGVIVRNETSAILGGIEDTTEKATSKNAPVLHTTGDTVMAGTDIRHEKTTAE